MSDLDICVACLRFLKRFSDFQLRWTFRFAKRRNFVTFEILKMSGSTLLKNITRSLPHFYASMHLKNSWQQHYSWWRQWSGCRGTELEWWSGFCGTRWRQWSRWCWWWLTQQLSVDKEEILWSVRVRGELDKPKRRRHVTLLRENKRRQINIINPKITSKALHS